MYQEIVCAGALTAETLADALGVFARTVRPERERLFAYGRGQQPVPKGEAVRGRPNNLLRIPFPRYITEVHTGYFLGVPPTVTFPKVEDTARFDTLAITLDLPQLLFALGRDTSVCGAAFALVWLEKAGLRVCRCDPLDCFALRSDTADRELLATVRLYQSQSGETAGVLYTPQEIRHFQWDGARVRWGEVEENLLRAIPLLPFSNNPDGCGDFAPVTDLVDAYNLLLSGAMDDMQSVANAFLALYGMQGTTQEDIDDANRTRVLSLSEGGRAEFVVKNLNHEALARLETNLRRSILQMSMTPDLSDDSFSGSASGVALQYKLWGIEQVRSVKEGSFSRGIKALLQILSSGLATLGETVDFSVPKLVFYKNLPQDSAALTEALLRLSGVVSQRTILEHLPWVSDPEAELARKKEEETK